MRDAVLFVDDEPSGANVYEWLERDGLVASTLLSVAELRELIGGERQAT